MVVIKKKTIKKVVYGIVIALVIYGGYQWLFGASYPDIDTPKPVFGNPDARVKIIEFSDIQCPACKSAHPVVQQIKDEFGDNISFQYYHYPLRAIHPYAQKAAEAVECANDQGKFWEYLDAAFGQSPNLQTRKLKAIAAGLQLDTDAFDNCLDSGAKRKIVEGDVRLGDVKKVRGTPTFFVNNRLVSDWSYIGFKEMVEREMEATG